MDPEGQKKHQENEVHSNIEKQQRCLFSRQRTEKSRASEMATMKVWRGVTRQQVVEVQEVQPNEHGSGTAGAASCWQRSADWVEVVHCI